METTNKKKAPPFTMLPREIRFDNDLPPMARLLYAEILSMSMKYGYCWASNDYLANLFDITKETTSRYISKLEKKGYITKEITYKKNSKEIDKRIIKVILKMIPQEMRETLMKASNQDTAIDLNVKDNI